MISSSFAVFAAVCIMALTLALLGLCVIVYVLAGHVYDLRGRVRRIEKEQICSRANNTKTVRNIMDEMGETISAAKSAEDAALKSARSTAVTYAGIINLRADLKNWIKPPKHMQKEIAEKERSA